MAGEQLRKLMGVYQDAVAHGLSMEIYDRFWSRRQDTCLEIGASGQFFGPNNAAAYYQKDQIPGVFQVTIVGNEQLEIRADGQTARGIWYGWSIDLGAGELSGSDRFLEERRKLWTSKTGTAAYKAECGLQKLDVAFVLENGLWKIWKMKILELVRCPMDRDFVSWAEKRFETDGPRLDALFQSNLPFAPARPPERMADEKTSSFWQYTWRAEPADLP